MQAIDRANLDPGTAAKMRGKIENKRDRDMLKTSYLIVFCMKRQVSLPCPRSKPALGFIWC